ncbi:MAG TPA: GIY-YIG nuclease family protein [Thermoanaerobaculia bacterium]
MRGAYVYMMSNKSHRLYVGACIDLPKRVEQHKLKLYPNGFTAKREKEIKGWLRKRKVVLIQAKNSNWLDLSLTWTDLLQVD